MEVEIPDDLIPFMNMTDNEIADMILMLMLEETAKKRLARFRTKKPVACPACGHRS